MKKLLIALLLPAVLTVGAQPYCKVRLFSLRDGLPSNVISSMGQTDDQLMWFSSWNGLSCYDGYSFTTFHDKWGGQRTLTTNRMLKITPSATGNLWCLTYDRQVFLFDRAKCRFINVSAMVNRRVGGGSYQCQRIAAFSNGIVWLFSREQGQSIYRIDERRLLAGAECMEEYDLANGRQKGADVYGVELDGSGREWLITDRGPTLVGKDLANTTPYCFIRQLGHTVVLATRDGRIGTMEEGAAAITPMQGLPPAVNAVSGLVQADSTTLAAITPEGMLILSKQPGEALAATALIPLAGADYAQADSRGRLWVLTGDGDAALVNPRENTAVRLGAQHLVPPLRQCTQHLVHEDRFGNVWIGTEQGFFGYYDEQQQRLTPHAVRTTATMPSIDRWFADSRGNLWIAGEHNVGMLSFSRRTFRNRVVEGMQQVRSLCFDSQGRLWAGDIAGHIALTDADGRLQGFLGRDGRLHHQPTAFSSHVYCLFEDSRHRLWIGTKGDGLYCLTGEGRLLHHVNDSRNPASLCSNQVYALHEDRQHRLWAGTFERGLALVEERGDSVAFIHAGNRMKSYPVADYNKVRRIAETPDGTIIASASNGLVAFKEDFANIADIKFYAHKHIPGDTASLHTSDVMQSLATGDGRIFVATVGGGMQELEDSNPLQERLRLRRVRLAEEGATGAILSMMEDKRGNIWVGRENSLMMYEAESRRLWTFGPGHLDEHIELTEAQPALNQQTGRMAFATTGGYVTFQPEDIGNDVFTPPLVFKSVTFHGTGETPRMLGDNQLLEVDADKRSMTVHFAALDYEDNSMIRYAYRLDGTDSDWNDLADGHSISFSRLPAGSHRLLVRSTNEYGQWADNEKALDIYVHPVFWETWWARLLYAVLALGIVAVGLWIYLLRKRDAQSQQQNRMLSLLLAEMKKTPQQPATEEADSDTAHNDRHDRQADSTGATPPHSDEEAGESLQEGSPHEEDSPAEDSPEESTPDSGNVLHLRPTDIVDSDKLLMEKLLDYIEDHLKEPELKIEDLAQAVCLGRTVFYNKVKSLVGMSPVELLRHVRIQHAADLVAKTSEPFSQIAYAVGFSDSRYFGKCFKKQTGLTPSEYRERLRQHEADK